MWPQLLSPVAFFLHINYSPDRRQFTPNSLEKKKVWFHVLVYLGVCILSLSLLDSISV